VKISREIGSVRVNLIHLCLGRGEVAGYYELGNKFCKAVDFFTSRENIVLSRRVLFH
jgi:hypothetical protein